MLQQITKIVVRVMLSIPNEVQIIHMTIHGFRIKAAV